MAERSLLDTISYISSSAGGEQLWSFSTPLLILLSIVPFMNYAMRKHLLNCTRIQSSQLHNDTLRPVYEDIVSNTLYIQVDPKTITWLQRVGIIPSSIGLVNTLDASIVLGLFENFYDSPTACTILSYFVRAERTVYPHEFIQVGVDSIEKELDASQLPDLPQCLTYRGLFTDAAEAIHEGHDLIPSVTTALWKHHLSNIKSHLSKDSTIILPHYNKRKNVSYETQSLFWQESGLIPSQEIRNVTTFDLLRIYAQYGLKILGSLELRQAWRFNDLKPRSYYCLGGDAFWDAIYIKDLTKMFISAFPSTHPFSRFEVKRIVRLSYDEILVTYDYSSFTTSLAELKYFLWYLATAFEDVLVRVLDVHEGIIEIDLGEYLHQYNQNVNLNQAFDISRVFKGCETFHYFQSRNGSLGVGGNIGLSGLVHGIALAGFNDTPDTDSVVGDDALLKTFKHLLEFLLVIINKLGIIAKDKMTTIPRPPIDNPNIKQQRSFKYLKRPISVNSDGEVETGVLDFFPNIAAALYPDGDGIHDAPQQSTEEIVRSYVMQVGKYLHQLHDGHFGSDPDSALVLLLLRSVYLKYGLPIEGSIPQRGVYVSWQEEASGDTETFISKNLWVPPLDTLEVFTTPWQSILFKRYAGEDVVMPYLMDGDLPLPVDAYPGLEFQTTSAGRFLSLMEDLGHFVVTPAQMIIPFDGFCLDLLESHFLQFGKRSSRALYDVYVESVPSYYVEYVSKVYGDPEFPEELWDARMELESLGLTSL
jgi:hypothetical protein